MKDMTPEDILRAATGQNDKKIWIPGEEEQPDPVDVLAMMVQRCEMGIAHVSRTNMLIGQATDLSQLAMQLIFSILVDNNLITKEELDNRYKEEVIETYKKMEEQAKKNAEEELAKQYEKAQKELEEAGVEDLKTKELIIKDAEKTINNVTKISRNKNDKEQ